MSETQAKTSKVDTWRHNTITHEKAKYEQNLTHESYAKKRRTIGSLTFNNTQYQIMVGTAFGAMAMMVDMREKSFLCDVDPEHHEIVFVDSTVTAHLDKKEIIKQMQNLMKPRAPGPILGNSSTSPMNAYQFFNYGGRTFLMPSFYRQQPCNMTGPLHVVSSSAELMQMAVRITGMTFLNFIENFRAWQKLNGIRPKKSTDYVAPVSLQECLTREIDFSLNGHHIHMTPMSHLETQCPWNDLELTFPAICEFLDSIYSGPSLRSHSTNAVARRFTPYTFAINHHPGEPPVFVSVSRDNQESTMLRMWEIPEYQACTTDHERMAFILLMIHGMPNRSFTLFVVEHPVALMSTVSTFFQTRSYGSLTPINDMVSMYVNEREVQIIMHVHEPVYIKSTTKLYRESMHDEIIAHMTELENVMQYVVRVEDDVPLSKYEYEQLYRTHTQTHQKINTRRTGPYFGFHVESRRVKDVRDRLSTNFDIHHLGTLIQERRQLKHPMSDPFVFHDFESLPKRTLLVDRHPGGKINKMFEIYDAIDDCRIYKAFVLDAAPNYDIGGRRSFMMSAAYAQLDDISPVVFFMEAKTFNMAFEECISTYYHVKIFVYVDSQTYAADAVKKNFVRRENYDVVIYDDTTELDPIFDFGGPLGEFLETQPYKMEYEHFTKKYLDLHKGTTIIMDDENMIRVNTDQPILPGRKLRAVRDTYYYQGEQTIARKHETGIVTTSERVIPFEQFARNYTYAGFFLDRHVDQHLTGPVIVIITQPLDSFMDARWKMLFNNLQDCEVTCLIAPDPYQTLDDVD